MKRRLMLFSLAAVLMHADGSFAQGAGEAATVTFYSHGRRMTSGVPGTHTGVFYGQVFDSKKRLFTFLEGFIPKKNLVISFELEPGPHTFFASYGKTPAHGGELALTLEAGKKYFVRAESESRGVVVVEFEKGRLEAVSCEVARQETGNAELLNVKHVSPQLTANIIPTPLPVVCP